MVHKKQFLFFNWFKEIIETFGQTEVGCSEVDIDALAEYLSSDKFPFDTFGYNSEEEAQEYITNYILDGFPVWRYLKCSDWTKNMVEKSFSQECKKEMDELKNKYKCYTCKHYKSQMTVMGVLEKCIAPIEEVTGLGRRVRSLSRRDGFSPQIECHKYERMDKNNE